MTVRAYEGTASVSAMEDIDMPSFSLAEENKREENPPLLLHLLLLLLMRSAAPSIFEFLLALTSVHVFCVCVCVCVVCMHIYIYIIGKRQCRGCTIDSEWRCFPTLIQRAAGGPKTQKVPSSCFYPDGHSSGSSNKKRGYCYCLSRSCRPPRCRSSLYI